MVRMSASRDVKVCTSGRLSMRVFRRERVLWIDGVHASGLWNMGNMIFVCLSLCIGGGAELLFYT